jgi:hypothetical protein
MAKKQTSKPAIEETLRRGDIVANVYKRQSLSGYVFFEYVIRRCWTSASSGKEQQGSSMHAVNEADLLALIPAATLRIRELNSGAAPESKRTNETIDNQPHTM